MDFFEAQARAKKQTSRLVVLFGLAVIGTIAAAYIATVFGLSTLEHQQRGPEDPYSRLAPSMSLWQPKILLGLTAGTLAIVGLASLFKWNQFSSGGSAVAESVGGRRVNPHTADLNERRLLNVVEEMAIASGTPVPAVYVLDDEAAINAFAAGLTTNDAVVAVTRGTLEKLTRDELQGVIGHEFSHILNGDMRLNLRLTAVLFGILVLGLAGRGILWSLRGARFRSRGKGSGGILAAIIVVGLALLIIGYVGYFFGRIIQAAVSRQREFLADASAVQFTRNPLGLCGALKKIGGYALGSSLQTSKAAAIGHFFFAQSFRSGLTGLWATHPPLNERIRAIEPAFDGKMFDPPEKIDVANESFVSAGLASVTAAAPQNLSPARFDASSALASAGTLTAEQISNAESLLGSLPAGLRDAAHSTTEAPAVIYGLLIDTHPELRQKQRAAIAKHAGSHGLDVVDRLMPDFARLGPAHKLPLLQISLPALRTMPTPQLASFLETLDELIHSDNRISPFEFALQKLLTRALALGKTPNLAVVQIYSFNAVEMEISVVLSALAQASTVDPNESRAAFAAGASQLKLIESRLVFNPEPFDFAMLDAALDKLAKASGPIKQRTLLAAAHVVSANGSVSISEIELLRATAAALDVPLPPLAP